MTGTSTSLVRVQSAPFDTGTELEQLNLSDGNIGAVVSFIGLCRNEAGRLKALELEHYPDMAAQQLERLAAQAGQRWSLDRTLIVHRFGMIAPGEPIVLVITASPHRADAFAAAEFLMDYLKTDAPFWKKEHTLDEGSAWVQEKSSDTQAKRRWD